VADALAWIRDAREAGVELFDDAWVAADALANGEIDGFIEGNWRFGDLREALGDDLGVVRGPSGPDGLFRPLTGVDGYVLNAESPDPAASAAVALAMTNRWAQRTLMEVAGHVPADRTIPITDPRVGAYAAAAAVGIPRPQRAEFDNYWGPFSAAFDAVVYDSLDPDDAVEAACAAMDFANGF
jgi:maltose-binding protein MalE